MRWSASLSMINGKCLYGTGQMVLASKCVVRFRCAVEHTEANPSEAVAQWTIILVNIIINQDKQMNLYTKKLSAALWPDFEAYFNFEGKSSGCWCMNHRLPIGLNFEGEAARLAMQQLVVSGRV